MDILTILNDKKSPIKFYNEKQTNNDIILKETETIMKNIPTTLITTIYNSKKIKKLKIVDEIGEPKEMDDMCLIEVDNKIRSINKNIAFIEFPDYEIDDMKINKNLFYIRYKLDDNIICNQFITNRFITFNFVYIDDDNYVCFLSKKDTSNRYRKLAKNSNNTLTLTINQFDIISRNYFKENINKDVFEFIQYYNYVNFNFISGVKTYNDIFKQSLKVFRKTCDLNYIKILDEFTKIIYDKIRKN